MARRLAVLLVIIGAVCTSAARAATATVPIWVREAIPAQLPPSTKDARAAVLLDLTSLQVHSTGTIVTTTRRVVKILTAAGREENSYAAIPVSNQYKAKSLKAWTIDARGNEYEVKERDAVETSPYDGELYSDMRMKIVRMPAADVGSIVAYESVVEHTPFVAEATWRFQEDVPVLHARLELSLAPNVTYTARWRNHAPVEPPDEAFVWDLRDIPAVADEPRMPSASTLAGKVGFHFFSGAAKERTWNDIAAFFSTLAKPRSMPTPALQAKVRELAADGSALRKLARFARNDVRYVAVEIGIGGYQPHAAGEVFTNRYGDCKDKATLLRTMLKEAGIDALFILVHTTRGAVDPDYPSISSFNHVISAIRVSAEEAKGLPSVIDHPKYGKLLIFDPTSTTTPFGHLPPWLQGSRGLLVTSDGGELLQLPSHPADANQLRRTAKLQLDEAGTLTGTFEETRTGSMASEMRYTLQSLNGAERVRSIESSLAHHLVRYTLSDVAIEHLEDPDHDLVIRYTVNAPGYARRVADMLLVRPRVIGQKGESLVDVASRQYGYVTEGPSLQTDEIEIAIAPSIQLDELPAAVTVTTPVVEYTSASKFADHTLRYQRRYAMKAFSVSKEALPELTAAFSKILADERASAVFK